LQARARKLLESDLRSALEANELQLLCQPLVNNSGEVVLGVEALCRWTHPQRGNVPPSEFIPVAEHTSSSWANGCCAAPAPTVWPDRNSQ
jgi:EAL domain-containing protein (putative c-di-GMP-specific phosphodiesterase class I)